MDWFTADTHFLHSNIIKHCHRLVFMTAEERAIMETGDSAAIKNLRISRETTTRMDEGELGSINQVVQPQDRLYILGDFCWTRNPAVYETFRRQIQCKTVYLLWGNHDVRGRHRAEVQCFSGTQDVLIFSSDYGGQRINIFLSHYAHAIWDKRHYGAWHLYGHSHGAAESWLDSIMPGRLSMDVGVDNAYKLLGEYRPFSLAEIYAIMSKQVPVVTHEDCNE
jgi:calcineurin-like phosphoesterase family protein